jgi:hypothetical protein
MKPGGNRIFFFPAFFIPARIWLSTHGKRKTAKTAPAAQYNSGWTIGYFL